MDREPASVHARSMKKLSARFVMFLAVTPAICMAQDKPPISRNDVRTLVENKDLFGRQGLLDLIDERGVAKGAKLSRGLRREAGPVVASAIRDAAARTPAWVPPPAENQAPLPAPLIESERAEFLERARSKAMGYRAELSGLTYLQTIDRHAGDDRPVVWESNDQIVARNHFNGERESSRLVTAGFHMGAKDTNRVPPVKDAHCDESDWIIACKMVEAGEFTVVNAAVVAASLMSGNLIGFHSWPHYGRLEKPYEFPDAPAYSAEFADVPEGLFRIDLPTELTWSRQGSIAGRAMEVYNYSIRVRPEESPWVIRLNGQKWPVPEFGGRIWLDRADQHVERITLVAVDLPRDYPFATAELLLDYNPVRLPDRTAALPFEGRLLIRQDRMMTESRSMFHRFEYYVPDIRQRIYGGVFRQ